jgi:small GTP-binding protein
VSIWDTAGQETYHSLAPLYYRSAAACIVVFDVSRPETFAQAKEWVKELQQKGPADVVLAIAANKCDVVTDFDLKSMREYADDIGAMFARTSAKTGEGIEDLFQDLGNVFLLLLASTVLCLVT